MQNCEQPLPLTLLRVAITVGCSSRAHNNFISPLLAPLSTFLAAFALGTTLDDPPGGGAVAAAARRVPSGDIADLERGQIVPQLRPSVRPLGRCDRTAYSAVGCLMQRRFRG